MCPPGKEVARDVVHVKLSSPECEDLTLVDLPGIVRSTGKGESEDRYCQRQPVLRLQGIQMQGHSVAVGNGQHYQRNAYGQSKNPPDQPHKIPRIAVHAQDGTEPFDQALLVVQALARPEWLVEIDGTAVIPE